MARGMTRHKTTRVERLSRNLRRGSESEVPAAASESGRTFYVICCVAHHHVGCYFGQGWNQPSEKRRCCRCSNQFRNDKARNVRWADTAECVRRSPSQGDRRIRK